MAGKYKYLTLNDRQRIAAWYLNGERACDIAKWLGVHTATIYHELQRGQSGELDKNQRLAYDPKIAQKSVQEGFKRRGRRQKISKAAL